MKILWQMGEGSKNLVFCLASFINDYIQFVRFYVIFAWVRKKLNFESPPQLIKRSVWILDKNNNINLTLTTFFNSKKFIKQFSKWKHLKFIINPPKISPRVSPHEFHKTTTERRSNTVQSSFHCKIIDNFFPSTLFVVGYSFK